VFEETIQSTERRALQGSAMKKIHAVMWLIGWLEKML
jgi:hypothetical protein